MKLLFLCSQNKSRSLTAEKVFDGYEGHESKSAGTETNARIKVTEGMIGWADIVFCMEKKHLRRLRATYAEAIRDKQVDVLNICDDYEYMDEELIVLLESAVGEVLAEKKSV